MAFRRTTKLPESQDPPNSTPAVALPKFPDPPAGGGKWTAAEHDAAVAAYEAALAAGDPDAGRMRTLLGLYGVPGREIHTGVPWGQAFKG